MTGENTHNNKDKDNQIDMTPTVLGTEKETIYYSQFKMSRIWPHHHL